MSETVEQLRALTDEELVRRHDHHAQRTVVGTQHYLDELNRRYQERQTASMLRFTKWITIMTIIITVATLANIGLTFAVLLRC